MTASDLLLKIKSTVQSFRDKKLQITSLEESLSAAKEEFKSIQRNELPDLMSQAGVNRLAIEPEGNMPGYEVKVKPFARANIAASWPHDQRQAAFDWLDEHGHGDLVKTEITISLPKDDRAEALDLIQRLRAMGFEPTISQATHHATMSKWLRECISRGEIVPLDLIGGEVGMEATIKETD